MRVSTLSMIGLVAVVGVVLWGAGRAGGLAPATLAAQAAPEPPAAADPYQRSADHYGFRATATRGAQHGEELYFYKCWFCHSELADRAPSLEAVGSTLTGQAVAEKIREGGPGMPAYQHTLSEADIADLLSYLRSEQCCWEGEEPPPQPRFRAGRGSAVSVPEAPTGRAALQGGAWGRLGSEGQPVEGVRRAADLDRDGDPDDGLHERRGAIRISGAGAGTLHAAHSPTDGVRAVSARGDRDRRCDAAGRYRAPADQRHYLLPPTPAVLAQLTGAEWLLNLPGTGEEKRVFGLACNYCHSYQQVFRNRYDARSWELIVQRMLRSSSSTLFGTRVPTPESMDRTGRPMLETEAFLANWLARVSGPDTEHAPLHYLPRERGRSTRVVITEYELPRSPRRPWRRGREHLVHRPPQPVCRRAGSPHRSRRRAPDSGEGRRHTGRAARYPPRLVLRGLVATSDGP